MKHSLYQMTLSLLCLTSMFLSGCNQKLPVPDFPQSHMVQIHLYEEEAQVLKQYPHLIQGKVEKVERIAKPNPDEDELAIATLTYIKVERTLRGDIAENETILLYLDGDGENYQRSDIQNSGGYYAEGDTALLFLSDHSKKWKENYKKEYRRQYRKDKLFPYTCHTMQGRFWLDEAGNILRDHDMYGVSLFQDCATVDELAEKYGLN